MMSCYSNYVQDHVHAIGTFFEVSKEPNFRQFLSHLHSKPATKGLTLPELLAVPLDRVSNSLLVVICDFCPTLTISDCAEQNLPCFNQNFVY